MSFIFSNTSRERLNTCDVYLIKVLTKAIELSPIDFGIAQGARTFDQQKRYFLEGKSKINPDNYSLDELPLKAKHIVTDDYPKSRAVDIYGYNSQGATWDVKHLSVVAGVILAVDKMYDNRLRWGGNWDMDSDVAIDQQFQDFPHFELIR